MASLVEKMPISFTVPDCPPTSTKFSSWKGRKVRSITPAAKLLKVPWKARAMARPAAPMIATKELACTPSVPTAVIPTRTMAVT